MRESLTMEELREIELGILDFIDETAKKNGITYYLDSGTLIGAVRHQGFIPWDDDIDIIVMRKDYIRLLKAINNAGQSKYRAMSAHFNDDFYYTFAKVVDTDTELAEKDFPAISGLGVFVDVFPVDYLPETTWVRKAYQYSLVLLRRLNYRAQMDRIRLREGRNWWFILTGKAARLIGWRRIVLFLDRFCARISKKPTRYAVDVVACTDWFINVPAACYGEPKYLLFEGKEYPAPQDHDTYLHIAYGDYMQLPPEEKQVTNHSFTAWRKVISANSDEQTGTAAGA